MNTVNNSTTIHLQFNQNRCLGSCNTLNYFSSKVYVPNKTENLTLSVFSMVTEINELMTLTKWHYHANVNVDLMEENIIKINGGITINVDVSVKNVMYVKNIMFGILKYVFVKMKNI